MFSLINSAVSATLLAVFLLNAVLRRHCCCAPLSIDMSCLRVLSSKPAARRSGCRAMEQTDRRTDARQLHKLDPYYARSVNNLTISL